MNRAHYCLTFSMDGYYIDLFFFHITEGVAYYTTPWTLGLYNNIISNLITLGTELLN